MEYVIATLLTVLIFLTCLLLMAANSIQTQIERAYTHRQDEIAFLRKQVLIHQGEKLSHMEGKPVRGKYAPGEAPWEKTPDEVMELFSMFQDSGPHLLAEARHLVRANGGDWDEVYTLYYDSLRRQSPDAVTGLPQSIRQD